MKIANFHCDLLSYLEEDKGRTAYDLRSRTSIPQMLAGKVALETLVTYVKTKPESSSCGDRQFQIYCGLKEKYKEFKEKIRIVFAIENASGFCSEEESLEEGFSRLKRWREKAGKIAYIGFTWHDENRFGGGDLSKVGLKEDGKQILEWMSGKKIAIDFSHTSDALAYGILNYIDQKKLSLTPIASHSNFRKVADVARNLPDELALEIGKRGGVIGLNFVRCFLGRSGPADFIAQIEYAAKLGLLEKLCLGADFFDDTDYPHERPVFLPGYEDSGCFPEFFKYIAGSFSQEQLEKIAYTTLTQFLRHACVI